MIELLKTGVAAVTGHKGSYLGLTVAHCHAAWATGHPGVYLPMALVYLWLALRA